MLQWKIFGGLLLGTAVILNPVQAQPTGPEQIVNTTLQGNQLYPDICRDGTGQVVAIWFSATSAPSGSIRAQRFDSEGQKLGVEWTLDVPVNGRNDNSAFPASVACSEGGGFVIVWSQLRVSNPQKDMAVMGRRFDAQGVPLGPRFVVNPAGPWMNVYPYTNVAMDAQGGFVVVWEKGHKVGRRTYSSLVARRFGANGKPLGPPQPVSQSPKIPIGGFSGQPQIAQDQLGRTVFLWAEGDAEGRQRLMMRRFGANGAALGGPVQLVGKSRYTQHGTIAFEPGNGFWVTWTDLTEARYTLKGQRFTAEGVANGTQVVFNLQGTDRQRHPVMSIDPEGQILVVWQEVRVCVRTQFDPESRDLVCVEYAQAQEGGEGGVRGRFFTPSGQPLGAEFGVNQTLDGTQGPAISVPLGDPGRFAAIWIDLGPELSCDKPFPQDPFPCMPVYDDSLDGSGTAIVTREVCLACSR